MDNSQSQTAWSNYWTNITDEKASCIVGDKSGIANDLLNQTWRQALSKTKEANMPIKVLELACGSGFLTRLAVGYLGDVIERYVAVDYADITSIEFPDKVEVIANTSIETLDLGNEKFDLIVSNFGFEYSNVEVTVPVITNLLAKDGRIVFNCHTMNSGLHQDSISIVNAYRQWRQQLPVEELYVQMRANPGDIELIKTYFVKLSQIDQSNQSGITKMGLIDEVLPLIQQQLAGIESESKMTTYIQNCEQYVERLNHQASASEAANKIVTLYNKLSGELLTSEKVFSLNGDPFSKLITVSAN